MLLLSRKEGEGVYIGRIARVTFAEISYEHGIASLLVEHEPCVAVSDYDVPGEVHFAKQLKAEGVTTGPRGLYKCELSKGEDIRIGRGVTIALFDIYQDNKVSIGVDAPKHIAVSRDDFTMEEHLRYQTEREKPKRYGA